jgi:hypothetical protein
LDGKTLRRSHDHDAGRAALHLVSAFATHERLILGQEATTEKSNEITAIPVLLERLAQKEPSTSFATPKTRKASNCEENVPVGTQTTSLHSSLTRTPSRARAAIADALTGWFPKKVE